QGGRARGACLPASRKLGGSGAGVGRPAAVAFSKIPLKSIARHQPCPYIVSSTPDPRNPDDERDGRPEGDGRNPPPPADSPDAGGTGPRGARAGPPGTAATAGPG